MVAQGLAEQLKTAVGMAQRGDWDASHRVVQDFGDPLACWIHAVLHKIEGDAWNSRYWYARSGGRHYEDVADPQEELRLIAQCLQSL